METVKEEEEEEEVKDRISQLPDCLLIEILCCLDSTKDVIRTRKLSKRWKYIWTFVPTLIFKYDDDDDDDDDVSYYELKCVPPISSFFSYIEETLTRRGQSKLKKFELDSRYKTRFQLQVNSLIRYAINCEVEELSLRFWDHDFFDYIGEFKFDKYFFTNSCITHLTLEGCLLNTTRTINWKTLRSLDIKQGKLDNYMIDKILSGTPVLETLKLENCDGYTRLDITSESVKNLVISGYILPQFCKFGEDFKDTLEISAPNILSFVIDGELGLWELLLLDVSSLVKVDLDYTLEEEYAEEKEEILKGIILRLSHVTEVKIGMPCFRTLLRLEAEGFVRPLNLKVPDVTPPESSDDDSQ